MVYGVHGSSSEGVLLAYCANKNPYRHQQSKLCTPYFVLKKATQCEASRSAGKAQRASFFFLGEPSLYYRFARLGI